MRTTLSLIAGARIATLLSNTLAEHPPLGYRFQASARPGALPLGGYLLSLGYIAPQHLIHALATQRQTVQKGVSLQLGDLLVRAQVIHPRVLTTVLLCQMVDRLLDPSYRPAMLGEQLIADGLLDPIDLAPALQLQIWLRQTGKQVPLGDLLVQQGRLTPQALAAALAEQRHSTQPVAAESIPAVQLSVNADSSDVFDAPPGITISC